MQSPCCLEKTFFCLWSRGTRSMTGLKKVTWGRRTHFIFKQATDVNEPFKCNYQRRDVERRCFWQPGGACTFPCVFIATVVGCGQLLRVALWFFCRLCVYLGQQQALGLQLQLNSVLLVVQELFQLHVLQGAQRAVVLPVDGELHLPRLGHRSSSGLPS